MTFFIASRPWKGRTARSPAGKRAAKPREAQLICKLSYILLFCIRTEVRREAEAVPSGRRMVPALRAARGSLDFFFM